MNVGSCDNFAPERLQALRLELSSYGKPDLRKSVWQLLNTFIPYVAVWVLMVYMLRRKSPFWEVIPLVLLASLFMVRIFILFHDCAHASFFVSRRANRTLGYIAGILTFTPYESWTHPHNIHHGTYADLDHRGIGDIWTLTSEEYFAASRIKRLAYRVYRSPAVLLGFGPPFLFIVGFRFTPKGAGTSQRRSVWITNVAVVIMVGLLVSVLGWRDYLMVQLPIIMVAANIGVWLFYVQHQFEGVYWSRHVDWDPMRAALAGSSYYRLPRVLQWITGNIGLHHVHHVLPRIPNYNLQRAYDEIPILQTVRPLTLRDSIRSLRLNLWDEKQGRLVSFRSLSSRHLPECSSNGCG